MRFTPLIHILLISGVSSGGLTNSNIVKSLREIQVEALGEISELLFVQFFLLVRDVLAFARLAQPIAFDGLGKNDGGLPRCSTARLKAL